MGRLALLGVLTSGGDDVTAATGALDTPDTNTVRASRYYLIGQCPAERTAALASALVATRNGALEQNLRDIFLTALQYRESPIVEAARQVANDPAADVRARSYAIALLLQYLRFDRWPSVDEMGSGLDASGQLRTYCSIVPGSAHRPVQHGAALEESLQVAIILDLKRIAQDASEPLFVRNVAGCWEGPGVQ